MMTEKTENSLDKHIREENSEWLESLDDIFETAGSGRVREIMELLAARATAHGVSLQKPMMTDYVNTISPEDQPPYPGRRDIERRIKSIIRWNAMAMVVRANRELDGIGGHISTYASSATLLEVGFNHFFRGKTADFLGDIIYFQGHGIPGIYSRAFLEGRLTEQDLINFRRELAPDGGLSSYPHPWLMPEFWEFPTVSMGLTSIMAIYQARFARYLENREVIEKTGRNVWAFLGDGELDEPESLGAISLASREHLDNLTFVVNCNLQRLDGPVRGNGKIIQELEAVFSGAGWNVIKVVWGSDWDPLLEKDDSGLLQKRMNEVVDGQYQKYSVSDGAYIRDDFFAKYPEVADLVNNYSDEQLWKLGRGGHDPAKVYAAYKSAVEHKGQPTVILAKTVKGYGLGEAGEGKNITHSQKKLNEEEMREFRSRFGIPISDSEIASAPFYRPANDSPEMKYMLERRQELGGYVPQRTDSAEPLDFPLDDIFDEYSEGTDDREVTTTMVMVHMISKLLGDPNIGKHIVPIVPDEARTFGMESLFSKFGIYSSLGQLYTPVDKDSLMFYNEKKSGAILEEGITEAGSISSFIAAATAYATHRVNMIPFFIYYSMFGFQRIGDFVWAAGDMQAKGFMIGGTSGRTTLSGEGLQHQDGNSHLLAMTVPNLKAYDPAFAYELSVIIQDGIRTMYVDQKNVFYYLTVMNEFYKMPPMPEGVEEGVLKGIYLYRKATVQSKKKRASLFGSGAILNEAIKAQKILEEKYKVATDLYSVTSYKELYYDKMHTDRHNLMNPKNQKKSYLDEVLSGSEGVFVAASDYVKAVPMTIASSIPGRFIVLGTDGYGRSEGRAELRNFFEVDARYIVLAALHGLFKDGAITSGVVEKAIKEMNIDPEKLNPLIS